MKYLLALILTICLSCVSNAEGLSKTDFDLVTVQELRFQKIEALLEKIDKRLVRIEKARAKAAKAKKQVQYDPFQNQMPLRGGGNVRPFRRR